MLSALLQEYLPNTLVHHSSLSSNPDDHILKRPDVEMRGKEWDEAKLEEYERSVEGGKVWDGRTVHAETSKGSHEEDLGS